MGYSIQTYHSPGSACRFLVGRNIDGCWVVCDRSRLVGGLFADKEAALHFAIAESEHLPGAVWCANDSDCLIADPWDDLTYIAKPYEGGIHISTAPTARSRINSARFYR